MAPGCTYRSPIREDKRKGARQSLAGLGYTLANLGGGTAADGIVVGAAVHARGRRTAADAAIFHIGAQLAQIDARSFFAAGLAITAAIMRYDGCPLTGR